MELERIGCFFRGEARTFRPPQKILISRWAEKNRILSDQSEEKGPLRIRRTPYLGPIMDAFLDSNVEQVVFMKSAQVGGTEAMVNVIGYYVDQDPSTIMFILADEDTASYINRERIQRMFRDSPRLHPLIRENKFNKGECSFVNGSYITMGWASSVARLASRPCKIIIFDEVDKPGYLMTSREAGPISLGINRTVSFFNRKIGILSTPTYDTGNINREIESCDIVYDWHVPCPYCGEYQPLRWSRAHAWPFKDGLYLNADGKPRELGQVKWSGGSSATPEQIERAGYKCGTCRRIWTTVEKNLAVENGKMVARKKIDFRPKKVGFHINRIYSLLGKSGYIPRLVEEFIDAKGDPKKLQDFINSTLGEPYKQLITSASESEILKATTDLEPQTVPENAVLLTAGIDPQKFGFWFVVRAWARNSDSWLIHYGFLESWNDVERLLFENKYKINGTDKLAVIRNACIDTGGGKGSTDQDPSMTEQSYWWIRYHGFAGGCRVWGTKGSSSPLSGLFRWGRPLDQTPSGKPLPGGLTIVLLDTDKLKDAFFARLEQARLRENIRPAYLHKNVGSDYARQISAEEKQLDEKGVAKWIRVRTDNHYLDCEILAMSCADPTWMGGGIASAATPEWIPVPESKPTASPGQQPKFRRPDMAAIRERLRR